MIDTNLSHLHPEIQTMAREFLAQCANAGLKVKIIETWRDPKREDELHAKGITKATGKTCKHCFMLGAIPASKAFDFALYDASGAYIRDGGDLAYRKAGELGRGIGMIWGGDFKHAPPDFDHFEIA